MRRRSVGSVVLVVMAGLGCGPVDPPVSDGSTSASASTGLEPLPTPTTTSSSPPTTTDADPGDSTDGETASGTAAASTSSGTDTGEPPSPVGYCADAYLGGKTRIAIWRRDMPGNTCTLLRLYDGSNDFADLVIDVPEPYRIEVVSIGNDAASCGASFDNIVPISATGSVVFIGEEFSLPDALDLDVTLGFDPVEPWIPETVPLRVEGLPVTLDECTPDGSWLPGR